MADAGERPVGGAPAPGAGGERPGRALARNAVVLTAVGTLWIALDLATKAWFNQFPPGTVVGGPLLGLVRLRVVHNTGGAWGVLDGATVLLGILAVIVCSALLVYVLVFARRATLAEVIGATLVFAGGVGNAVDRFTLGYVVDFIDPVFIDFPTFNIADIGVTCGFVIFIVALARRWRREERAQAAAAGDGAGRS
ncbi:signal peptidase II [Adlercreutzia faecimuris]|uniref:Lipoprotein signal peptidase n=1 Tax=Adlercreutzia faecimuris TaxID=2897341 RepID=A0ABS9WH39_9ACTN|nr:signal peptidase II [Adlercreutzia sp. JBNU-10]